MSEADSAGTVAATGAASTGNAVAADAQGLTLAHFLAQGEHLYGIR
jgi:hypothetical protein